MALIATPAFALDYTYDGGGTDTLDGGGAQYNNIFVLDDGSGNPSTLTIDNLTTASGHSSYVSPFNGSTLIIDGGTYDGFVGAPYYYTFNGTEGAYDATLEINGGEFHYRIKNDDGYLNIEVNGGSFDNQYDTGSGYYMSADNITINGGTFTNGTASEYRIIASETMTVTGGTFSGNAMIRTGPQATISGGDHNYRLYFYGADGDGEAWVTGGDFLDLEKFASYGYGDIHISGGQFQSSGMTQWSNEAGSTYYFYGTGWDVTDYTDPETFNGTYYYQVTGTLCDGNDFNMFGSFGDEMPFVFNSCPSNEIPEPATMALLGLGALGLAGARRRR
jgi:hypothetical protein